MAKLGLTVIAAVLLITAISAAWILRPAPPITIAADTTWIVEPLGADGLPNYLEYLRQESADGVTADTNAAIPIWRAMWPGELSPADQPIILTALSMDVPTDEEIMEDPYSGSMLTRTGEWLRGKGLDPDQASDAIDLAEQPWTAEQLPIQAEWVSENQIALDQLLLGLEERPHFYSPSPAQARGEDESLLMTLLPAINGLRMVARGTRTRAMWHAGRGDPMKAWDDLEATLRISRHASNNRSWMISHLVGIAIQEIAARSFHQFMHASTLTPEQARQILNDLEAIPAIAPVESFFAAERLAYLDICVRVSANKMSHDELLSHEDSRLNWLLATNKLDWDIVMRRGNAMYTEIAAATAIKDRDERKRAMAEIDRRIQGMSERSRDLGRQFQSSISQTARAELMSDVLGSLMIPAVNGFLRGDERGRNSFRLMKVSAALAVFRAEHGEYPISLEQLVPDVLPTVPQDLYSSKPYIYHRMEDGGYLLYSVFQNEADDGGSDYGLDIVNGEWVEPQDGIDYEASDQVVRVPGLPFKLPSQPLPTGDEYGTDPEDEDEDELYDEADDES